MFRHLVDRDPAPTHTPDDVDRALGRRHRGGDSPSSSSTPPTAPDPA